MSTTSADEENKRKNRLHVTVYAPRFPDKPRRFTWKPETLVGEAADEAAEKFKYQPGAVSLAKGGRAFNRDETLKHAGVRDGDTLDLVDVGGGV
jgi:hypothetical protein